MYEQGLCILESDEDSHPYNFPNKKIILCGVPGAFTPGCTNEHLPGFASNLDKLKEKGIEKVIFISINDAWVMNAWNKHHGHPDIDCIGDPHGLFTDQINKTVDYGPGKHKWCSRFAVLIENGEIVKEFSDPFINGVLNEL